MKIFKEKTRGIVDFLNKYRIFFLTGFTSVVVLSVLFGIIQREENKLNLFLDLLLQKTQEKKLNRNY